MVLSWVGIKFETKIIYFDWKKFFFWNFEGRYYDAEYISFISFFDNTIPVESKIGTF